MKKLVIALAIVVFSAGVCFAVNWGNTIVVNITPDGDRGVIIGSSTINVTLTLGSTVYLTGIPVTSTGTIVDIEYTLQGVDSMDAWGFSADGEVGANTLAVHGLFNSTQPTLAEFEGGGITTHMIDGSVEQVGDDGEGTTNGTYEGNQDMDMLDLNEQADLWLQLKAPTSTSSGAIQDFNIEIVAEPGAE